MSTTKTRADWTLLIPVGILLIIGVIMIISTSSAVGLANYHDGFYFIKKHTGFLALGAVAFAVGLLLPHQSYRRMAFWGLLGALVLMVLSFVPGIGVKVGGARRWIDVGLLTFQPVEVAKFFLVVFLAVFLENKQSVIRQFTKVAIPIMLVFLMPVLILINQPDLGNIGLILLVMATLLFLAKIPIWQFVMVCLSGLGLLAINLSLHPYQWTRITAFLDPWADPLGKNYHMIQSLTAIGSGGFWGLGLGESKMKFFYLPLQYSDFIFSIICEEGGFILAAIIIGLYGFLFFRGIDIAKKSGSSFSYFLCMGLLLMLIYQAFLNIGVVIGVLPVTGIPLTFISFGGTSLVTSLFYMGVILNVSKEKAHDN